MKTMKAVICTKYGTPDVLHIQEVNKPIPKDNEILVRIVSTAVNSGDTRVRGLAVEGFKLGIKVGDFVGVGLASGDRVAFVTVTKKLSTPVLPSILPDAHVISKPAIPLLLAALIVA